MRRSLFLSVLILVFALPVNAQPTNHNEETVAQLQAEMASGKLTSVQLTQYYIDRINALDQIGPNVNSVIEFNPDALSMAQKADDLRAKGTVLGPLHGIPVLLKDNIDTGDKMQTSAGSFALVGKPAIHDSTVAAKLRAGGAVILGKTNLSEWANFRSFFSSSGWSGRGGLTHNPYSLDRNPCGSSSGSAAAVSSNFSAVSYGSETDGSIVCPANVNSVVGIKPTVGLTSRAGVVPISHTQDTVGPHARTVADAAAALNVIVSRTPDKGDSATSGVPLGWQGTGRTRPTLPPDYTAFVDPNGLRGARLGVTRQGIDNAPPQVVQAFDNAIATIQSAGATVVDLDSIVPASANNPQLIEAINQRLLGGRMSAHTKQVIAEQLAKSGYAVQDLGTTTAEPCDYPDFARLLVEAGIDSISVTPDSFVGVKQHVAAAEATAVAAEEAEKAA